MIFIEENIKGLCDRNGLDYHSFLSDFEVDHPTELSVSDIEVICEEYDMDTYSFVFKHLFKENTLNEKLSKIKLLVLDVDGVMTDGGMYFSEEGDQMKKFNTKDGMAIIHLTKSNFQVAIISSGFKGALVEKRAEMLGIQHCTVSRTPKMDRLKDIIATLGLSFEEVAMIGDDINDLEVMSTIGFTACPSDAVMAVKRHVNLILKTRGGEGCIREFIDNYLLTEPIN